MISRFFLPAVLVAVLVVTPALGLPFARARQGGDEPSTRSSFLKTRPKTPAARPVPKTPPKKGSPASPAATSQLGLGYTIFQQNEAGRAVRVPATRAFRSGDKVRLLIEANSDGFLYIFNTENDGVPEMIFPDPRLNDGGNFVRAHVPHEVPSSREADPQNRWFEFKNNPGTEKLYLVFARKPLPDILIGERLVVYCKVNSQQCPWRPSDMAWRPIAGSADNARVERAEDAGREITQAEQDATSRSIGLPSSAPAPSVVKLNSSGKTERVMLVVELTHR